MYSTVSEWDRIIKEQKAKQAAELEAEIERMKAMNDDDSQIIT